MISLIYACDLNGAIGKDNTLPWHLPEDLKRFKGLTLGGTIVMGRKTYESLPSYPKGLPGRRNIVVSRTLKSTDDVEVVDSLDNFLRSVKSEETVWVIGGGEIYRSAIKYASSVYQTLIDTRVQDADTWFKIDDYPEFDLVKGTKGGAYKEESPVCFWYMVYNRTKV